MSILLTVHVVQHAHELADGSEQAAVHEVHVQAADFGEVAHHLLRHARALDEVDLGRDAGRRVHPLPVLELAAELGIPVREEAVTLVPREAQP